MLAPGEASQAGITVFYEDQELGARLAVRHLVHLGHRDVAHLAGNQEWLDGQVRLRGWQAELDAHEIPAGAIRYGDWSGESAYRIGRQMVAEGLPSSIFVASDLMALAFLRALYEAGVSVPGDISVVGFDDNEFAPQMHPPLTTVRQSFATVGSRCMEILLRAHRRPVRRHDAGHPRSWSSAGRPRTSDRAPCGAGAGIGRRPAVPVRPARRPGRRANVRPTP